MKIIDLLNINGKEKMPKKVRHYTGVYIWEKEQGDFLNPKRCEGLLKWCTDTFDTQNHFIDEVEIIEPQEHKIPEKIKIDNEDRIQALSTGNYCYKVKQIDKIIIYKINEILDYLEVNND